MLLTPEKGREERWKWEGFGRGCVAQACKTDIPAHVITEVCLLAGLAMYLSTFRFLSLNVNAILLPLDFMSH